MKTRTIRAKRYDTIEQTAPSPIYYPTINLNLKDLPEAKEWEVGEDYTVELTLRLKSRNEDKDYGGSATFEIREVGLEEEEDEDE